MTKDAAAGRCRDVTLQNVKIRSANGGRSDPYDGIRCLHNRRLGPNLPGPATRPLVHKGVYAPAGITAVQGLKLRAISRARSIARFLC